MTGDCIYMQGRKIALLKFKKRFLISRQSFIDCQFKNMAYESLKTVTVFDKCLRARHSGKKIPCTGHM